LIVLTAYTCIDVTIWVKIYVARLLASWV